MSEAQTWWATELYPTKDDENFGIVGDHEVMRVEDVRGLRDERDRLAELVRQAQPHVCSLLCPSIKARHELWTHTKLCLNMQAALAPAGGRAGIMSGAIGVFVIGMLYWTLLMCGVTK